MDTVAYAVLFCRSGGTTVCQAETENTSFIVDSRSICLPICALCNQVVGFLALAPEARRICAKSTNVILDAVSPQFSYAKSVPTQPYGSNCRAQKSIEVVCVALVQAFRKLTRLFWCLA